MELGDDDWMKVEEKGIKYEHPVALWGASASFMDEGKNRVAVVFGGAAENRSVKALTGFFDLDHNKWLKHDLPKAVSFKDRHIPFVNESRWGHSATVCPPRGNDAYIIGGWDSSSQFSEVLHYNFSKNTLSPYTTKGTGPSPRAGHTAIAVGSNILVFGGACCEGGPYTYYNDLYLLDTVKGVWDSLEIKGEKPSPRSQHNALLVGDTMILLGGYCGKVVFNDIWCLNLKQKPLAWNKMFFTGEPEGPSGVLGLTPTNFRVRPSTHIVALLGYRENTVNLFVGGMCDDPRNWILTLDLKKGTRKWTELNCKKSVKLPGIPRASTFIAETVEDQKAQLDEWQLVTRLSIIGGFYTDQSKQKAFPKQMCVSFQHIRSTVAL
eukprot:TRINITY_DN2249_c0_g1_i7.p1 TRINITY_DN2249_c0_g1~~TRINITY_DN2249_c0_g1_i7.p1  ORF type:complete len:386 (-),score=35.75 TRINITY_DN2249_c0_g1_i7:95-1231(-)